VRQPRVCMCKQQHHMRYTLLQWPCYCAFDACDVITPQPAGNPSTPGLP
jgi:hypothetical protein